MDANIYVQLIFLIIVNVFFTFAGIILNALVLISVSRSSQLRKKLCHFMIMVLSFFDLLAVTNHPSMMFYIVFWINEKLDSLPEFIIYWSFSDVFLGFSFVTLLMMSIERYLGLTYPIFHRTSVTKRTMLKLLAVFFFPTATLYIISVNDFIISRLLADEIMTAIVFPPLFFINYKLFMISRRVRRDNAESSRKTTSAKLKNVSSCLLAVSGLFLCLIPASFYFAFYATEEKTSDKARLSNVWVHTMMTMNSTFNCLVFFWKNKVLRSEGVKVLKSLKNRLFNP